MSLSNVIQELVIRIRYVVDNGGLERTHTAIASLKRMVGGLAVGAALYKIGRTAWQTAADLEAANAQFETMLGSKAAAEKMMNEMWEYAALSTFEMSHVTKAATTMLNYGLSQEQTGEYMKRLGDIAGANAPKFERMALAFAQMFGKTRLTGEELRQFVNAGANPLKKIAEMHFGGDYAAAEDAMRKRKISSQMVFDAIRAMTDEGGQFYQNQLRQSQTLTGLYTTMIDRLKMVLSKGVMAFSVPIKAFMRLVGSLKFQNIIDGIQWLSYALQYIAMIMWQSGLSKAWENFKTALEEAGYALEDAGGATSAFGNILFVIGTVLGKLLAELVNFAAILIRVVYPIMSVLIDAFKILGEAMIGVMIILEGLGEVFNYIYESIAGATVNLKTFLVWLVMVASFIGTTYLALAMFAGGVTSIWVALKGMVAVLPAAITGVAALLGPVWASVAAVLAMGWAIYKLNKALDEMVMRSEMDGENAARGAVEDELNKRSAELTDAEKTGDKEKIAKAHKRWKALRDAYKKVYLDKPFGEPDFGDTSFEAFVKREQEGSSAAVKKIVDTSGKTTNINQKVDFKVDVKGDKNAKTGLTAADVALLAERASRATFSIELERVLEGTI